jgi:hypothetical protein
VLRSNLSEYSKPSFSSSRKPRPASIFRPYFRWRRNQGSAAIGFDNGTLRGTIHETDGGLRIGTAFVDLQEMLRGGRNHDRVDVDFATGNIAHPALGALLVVDS